MVWRVKTAVVYITDIATKKQTAASQTVCFLKLQVLRIKEADSRIADCPPP